MSGDMATFLTSLSTGGISSTGLWAEVNNAATFIASISVFAFGYYVVRKAVKGAAKGKVRI